MADVAALYGLPREMVPRLVRNGSLGGVVYVDDVAHVRRASVESFRAPAMRLREELHTIAERNGGRIVADERRDRIARLLGLI